MKRILAVLRDYKEIVTLLAATAAIIWTPLGHAAVVAMQPQTVSLSVRLDSVARNVDVLIKLQCIRERDKWDELSLAGIPCARLVTVR